MSMTKSQWNLSETLPVVVNGRFRAQRMTGVQRVAHELTRRLVPAVQVAVPMHGHGMAGHAWEQTTLAAMSRRRLLWNPCAVGPLAASHHVTTIHDLFAIDHPEWYAPAYARWHKIVLSRLVKSATHLIAVSEYTRTRVMERFGCEPDKISVVHNGLTSGMGVTAPGEIERVRQELRLPSGRYLLTLSSLEPRKNLATVLRAWQRICGLVGEDCWLVVAGAKASASVWAQINIPADLPRVHFTGYVKDEDLSGLYSGASAFLFPSLDEGFGIPLLEAMACGVRTIASDVPALREVAGDLATYVSPLDVDELAAAMLAQLRRDSFGPCQASILRAQSFNWEDAAARTGNILATVAATSLATKTVGTRTSSKPQARKPSASDVGHQMIQNNKEASAMKVALVHDWLTGMRGGEKVLSAIGSMYPDAPLWTLLHVPGSTNDTIEQRRIHHSLLQYMPSVRKRYRHYLPLFPLMAELNKARNVDLVISTSHAVAKAMVRRGHKQNPVHVCYIHTPMRYAWDRFEDYFGAERVGGLASRFFFKPITRLLQMYDRATVGRVDLYVANSQHIAQQVRKHYQREALVIPPPVEVERFQEMQRDPQDWYLVVSALAPYKRVEDAIRACHAVGRPLKIVGKGPEMKMLQALAAELGAQVDFVGFVSDEDLGHYYRQARALLFPGVEDFGIVPVESIACGCPVIALGEGGILDSMTEATALFYHTPGADALASAIGEFETKESSFHPEKLREHARGFREEAFIERMQQAVQLALKMRKQNSRADASLSRRFTEATASIPVASRSNS